MSCIHARGVFFARKKKKKAISVKESFPNAIVFLKIFRFIVGFYSIWNNVSVKEEKRNH